MIDEGMVDIGMLVAIDREIRKEEENKEVELNPQVWSII